MQLLETILTESNKHSYDAKVMELLKVEKEFTIIDKLVQLMKQIVSETNYERILVSLFDKFKNQQNIIAIDTIFQIEDRFGTQLKVEGKTEVADKFQTYVILYVWIPLLDLYSNQSKKLGKKHQEILEKLLHRFTELAQEKSSHGAIVLDWSVKSLNFTLCNTEPVILNMQIFSCYLEIVEDLSPQAQLNFETILKALAASQVTEHLEHFLITLLSMMAGDQKNKPHVEAIIHKYSEYREVKLQGSLILELGEVSEEVQPEPGVVRAPASLSQKIPIKVSEL